MNKVKNTGLVLCGLALGLSLSAPAAQAVESLKATLSTNRILVDGQETHMTAYTINGNNYTVSAITFRPDGAISPLCLSTGMFAAPAATLRNGSTKKIFPD